MTVFTKLAFEAELKKIAVDVEELDRRVRAAGNVHIGSSDYARAGGGGLSFATARQGAARATKVEDANRKFLGKFPGFMQPTVREKLGPALMGFAKAQREAGHGENAGSIHVDPTRAADTFHRFTGRPSVGEAGEDALGATTAAHELYERRVRPKDMVGPGSYYSHNSPEVLLKEHNLLARLTGKGSEEARQAVAGTRSATGEADNLRTIVHRTINDPRADVFLSDKAKIPKAMRKLILKKVRENPGLIEQTLGQKLKMIAAQVRYARG